MTGYDKIVNLQKRCQECGCTHSLQNHHRFFRGEDIKLQKFLQKHKKDWGIDDVQNLVRLCEKHHIRELHNKNKKLEMKYRNTYTDPKTGLSVPYEKKEKNYLTFLK